MMLFSLYAFAGTAVGEVEDDEFMEKLTMSYNMDPVNKKNQIDFTTGTAYEGLIFIPMQSNENQVLVANSQAYIGKPNADQIKAMQDATIYGGGYDVNSRRFSGLSGTSSDDL